MLNELNTYNAITKSSIIDDITNALVKLNQVQAYTTYVHYYIASRMSDLYNLVCSKKRTSAIIDDIISSNGITINVNTYRHIKAVAYALDSYTITSCYNSGMSFESLYRVRKLENPIQYAHYSQKEIRVLLSGNKTNDTDNVTMSDMVEFLESKGYTLDDVKAFKASKASRSSETSATSNAISCTEDSTTSHTGDDTATTDTTTTTTTTTTSHTGDTTTSKASKPSKCSKRSKASKRSSTRKARKASKPSKCSKRSSARK